MVEEKKEVAAREEIEKRSTLKASYLIVGLIFFLAAIFLSLTFENLGLFIILLIVTGVLFFISGVSYYDYGDIVKKIDSKNTRQKFDLLLKKQEWHNEIDLSLKISFGMGGTFFILAIVLFLADSTTYFLPILFCDCIGATILTYAFKLSTYKEKIEDYEKTLSVLEEKIHEKDWEYQGTGRIR